MDANNRYLKDQALADAVEKQPWDPSVQAMAAFPDVVKLLSDNIAWMTDLGTPSSHSKPMLWRQFSGCAQGLRGTVT